MLNDRKRILELALESLELKKKQINEEIAEISRQLRGKSALKTAAPKVKKTPAPKTRKTAAPVKAARKRSRFTKEERIRRSQRMKEYWEKRRKKTGNGK
jgi:hypothetical protein